MVCDILLTSTESVMLLLVWGFGLNDILRIGICCFCAKPVVLRNKTIYWLVGNRIMCKNEVTGLLVDCFVNELALKYSN